MGAISFNLDVHLVQELLRHLPLRSFVETGTFRGDSLEAVHALFAECLSVELSPEHYEAARQRFAHMPNLVLRQGNSATVLRENRSFFAGKSTLFWLDAHWCVADGTAGERSQCPVLDELAAIGELPSHSIILIDDARLYLSPPPLPHEFTDWPSLDEILRALHKLSDRHAIICFNDVLLFLPQSVAATIRPYLHRHGYNLLSYADKARDYDAILRQSKTKEIEIQKIHAELLNHEAAAEERRQALVQSTEAADRLRQDAARLTVDLRIKETSLLAVHEELKQLTDSAADRLTALEKSTAEADYLRAETAQLSTALQAKASALTEAQTQTALHLSDLMAKEAVIQDLLRTCNERLQLINRLALNNGLPTTATVRVASHHVKDWFKRSAQTIRSRLTRWARQGTSYQIGKLVQHSPRPIKLEKFPTPRPPRQWPRLCIITPSYNQAHFLSRTIQSVLDQNYPNLAYGIQDGGSTDGSDRIIQTHVARLFHGESAKDEGQADAIQKGFKKLQYGDDDIMAWLNSDDVLMPGALAYVGSYFAQHPDVDVIYGHRVIIDENDGEVGRWFLPKYHADTLKWFDLVPQETMFWRARCFKQVGGLDPTFHFAMDWDLLLRFEAGGANIRRVPYFLGCFRVHSMQKTSARIQTLGESEMSRLRFRVHQREISPQEIHRQFNAEIGRSARVAWLADKGLRF